MTTIYLINDKAELTGAVHIENLTDLSASSKNWTELPPPEFDSKIEIPILTNGKWSVVLTEKGKETLLSEIRIKRNQLIAETDWVFAPDVQLDLALIEKVTTYRQELRDITENLTDLKNVVWPQSPLVSKVKQITADKTTYVDDIGLNPLPFPLT